MYVVVMLNGSSDNTHTYRGLPKFHGAPHERLPPTANHTRADGLFGNINTVWPLRMHDFVLALYYDAPNTHAPLMVFGQGLRSFY